MNVYKAKLRAMYLKANEQKEVAENLPKKFKITKHLHDRMKERYIKKVDKNFFYKNTNISNLLDIQITVDNKITYIFRVKQGEKYIAYVVSQGGEVLTVWKEKKIRNTKSGIHTTNFNLYHEIIMAQ